MQEGIHRMEQFINYIKSLYDQASLPVVVSKIHKEEIMLPCADGVRLRTQYFLPERICPAPTVVIRSCYPHQEPMLLIQAEAYAKRGFGFVLQWCRGTGGSEGEWEPNVHDRADGLCLMHALQQDDRIGPIGYLGDSYLAFTGWVMADAVPEKVKTMILGVYGCDRHTSAYKDGLFRQDILTAWAMGNAGRKVDADYMESAAYRPQVEVDEALWGGKLSWYRDNTYYHLLSKESRAHTTVQIGPWNHGYRPAITHQDLSHLTDDSVDTPMLWFDRILRKGEVPEAAVRQYVIGADCWREYKVEDAPATETVRFWLDDKTLCDAPSPESGSVSYVYDPADPVLSYGAESLFSTMQKVGSLEQPEPDWRPDVKSFLSAPLTQSLEIHGSINVKLFVQTDAEDTSFTAKLMEVFPDGKAVNIRGSITTLAYRNGRPKRGTYTPGEIVEINIQMWDVAWKTQAGSRLRLDVSSSDFPQYAVHPNYPGIWSMIKETRTANETVWFGAEHPSCVELPVITE